jgi:ribosomal protein L4
VVAAGVFRRFYERKKELIVNVVLKARGTFQSGLMPQSECRNRAQGRSGDYWRKQRKSSARARASSAGELQGCNLPTAFSGRSAGSDVITCKNE